MADIKNNESQFQMKQETFNLFVVLHYYSHHSLCNLPEGHGHCLNLQQLAPAKFLAIFLGPL